ncbi:MULTISPECIES: efflux RND transporter periplasmic adaptor subunit [Flavobacteriaceae]|uniref:Efflux RND transporter periplasmic adaptor subunit n=2 Tax=Flavobacteriaceae TaxID=49546 RepID=A0A4Y8ATJ7_9FLAO|nr:MULTISPECIES: efflux RND transporter periplasmic adaptor subunit [Flavobacteriaceae]TEW75221.1 efflux RND transporter periplasmic adaptor subunit [Gramella jeungdoensis]GGK40527.1 hypothetical protein GCM10007963_05720 [Lutibacter litoralis]
MKKYIIYIGILALGLLFGWLLFGGSPTVATQNHNTEVVTNQQWTCSMHPQIMQPEAGDCPICGMDLIPAESGSDGLLADQFKLTENAMALANIQTTIVGNVNAEATNMKLSGKIVENEEANAVQVSYFSGRIERLHINFTGEAVRKGQLLASIYSPQLYAAQQELITAASLKIAQPALYKAVRNKLKIWKLSENQINQIEATGKVQENIPVYATVSGTVSEKLVAQGDYIKEGQPLFKISNFNTVWANFDVYENQIAAFKKGQEVTVTTTTYPNKQFMGKVDFIDPVLDTKTRIVALRVVLNNKNNLLKPGMFVAGEIKSNNLKNNNSFTIPSSAVLWTGKRSLVYIKPNPEQSIFQMQQVQLGNQIGENYAVLEGLKQGDEIVTNGTFTVDAAAQLQGKKSMMNVKVGKVSTGHEDHLGTNATPTNATNNHTQVQERIQVAPQFQQQLNTVFSDYINLKNALVKDKFEAVLEHSKSILKSLSQVDMKLLKEHNTHDSWMSFEKELQAAATAISTSMDIQEQRNHFIHLSTHLTKAVEMFGVNETVYQQFCPMVANNKGAFWLSKEAQILNPYFGDAMLKCGEVKQVIAK